MVDDLRAELAANQESELEFSVVLPPGWARFGVDAEAERRLTANMMAVLRERSTPAETMSVRQFVHAGFTELRRQKAVACYLPVAPVDDIVIPASITVAPAPVRSPDRLEEFAQRVEAKSVVFARGRDEDGLEVWRWEQRRAGLPGEGGEDAGSRTVSYLFEAPRGSRRTPAVVSGSLLYAAGEAESDFAEDVLVLLDAIMGTFTWSAR
ncbi:hypothetical protein [Microbacterium kyungheense]|uniref:Uncharacterized protein n=1 Tax=Microbacterium kyungheense TaxID=1263636 RepID=A0A543FJI9_9MICO|nr:hypothetical protein [Microbacterium kyungheense]TQM34028.1 hypothetical protein FB391_0315 [Microbacterium kyungheense]